MGTPSLDNYTSQRNYIDLRNYSTLNSKGMDIFIDYISVGYRVFLLHKNLS